MTKVELVPARQITIFIQAKGDINPVIVTVKKYFVLNCYIVQHMYKHRLLQTLLSATIHKQEEMFML